MRQVILFMHISLDGFTAGPDGAMDWIIVDDEVFTDAIDLQNTADTALFGRVLYEEMAGYWPTVPDDPSSSKHDLEHATWLNSSPKLVFSATLEKAEWSNTRIVKENIAEEIQKLKQQPGKNLILFGGASIASTFIRLGLIDEYRLNVNPVVLGNGKPLFKGIQTNLTLLGAKRFESGVVGLRYRST